MRNFSDLGIEVSDVFDGDKIEIERIIDKKITVLNAEISKSKYKGNCLKLHFEFEGERRITFTSGSKLLEAMEQAKEESFPFNTVIKKVKKTYKFS